MDKLKILMSLFILSAFFLSCDKEESTEEPPFYKISESLHPFVFSVGSSWIYSNPVNSNIDTLFLTDFESDSFTNLPSTPGQGPQGATQFFNLSYESSFSENYEEQLVGYIISRGLISGGYTYLSSYQIGDENKNALLTDILDTLVIGDFVFNNVVKMNVYADGYIDYNMNLYYVDSVGVVRKEITEDNSIIETWDLIEYDVTLFEVE